MMDPRHDPILVREGIERLQRLLPEAAVLAEARNGTPTGTGLMEAMLPYLKRSNMEMLLVHPAPRGGWYADLVFRDTPIGVSDVVGTPVHTPHRTREDAESYAVEIVAMALAAERDVGTQKLRPGKPVFSLGNGTLPLDPEMLSFITSVRPPDYGGAMGARSYAEQRLEGTVAALFPAGVTDTAFELLGQNDRKELLSVIYIAASTGCLAYPIRRAAEPT